MSKDPHKSVGTGFLAMGSLFALIGCGLVYMMKTNGDTILPALIFVLFGSVFAIVGYNLRKKAIKAEKRAKWLKNNGQLINAKITNVVVDTSVSINDKHPYIVVCGYLAPNGQYFEFRSRGIWVNPQGFIGSAIPVYVNPQNPNDYYVNVDSFR